MASSSSSSSSGSGGGGSSLNIVDVEAHKDSIRRKPWKTNPHYFSTIHISAIALLKMTMHASRGGSREVLGLMTGWVRPVASGGSTTSGSTASFGEAIVTDAFALPVEGTETRVSASNEAYEYIGESVTKMDAMGRKENIIGWYHSHPGYGCWLSGIDVATQLDYQSYSEPWFAVVVDPVRTTASGRPEVGAFRVFPEDYHPADDAEASEYQSIPMAKIEDFGVHSKKYYQLDLKYWKSDNDTKLIDLLWNKYWVNTLGSSALLSNIDYMAGQVGDLADKMEQAENKLSHEFGTGGNGSGGRMGMFGGGGGKWAKGAGFDGRGAGGGGSAGGRRKQDGQLGKLAKDSAKVAIEQITGTMTQGVKDSLFNSVFLG